MDWFFSFFLVVYMDWVLPKRNQDQVVNPRLDLGDNQHTIKKFIQLLPTAKVQNQQLLPTAEIHPIPNHSPMIFCECLANLDSISRY